MTVNDEVLINVDHVSKSFTGAVGDTLLVLDDINLDLRASEIVALLGRSGSGKSTLLRTIAGLIGPSSGSVRYRGEELNGANPGAAMVFQTFALMPWLTVQDNVELGLAARGVAPADRTARALKAIDMIGLDGFESAYPKELSGGMGQRVGFARALVLEPDLLLMDEPFSALDVLTAENLRTELMALWAGENFPTRAICLVTHNIEEAVLLADRVIVLSANPGHIRAELRVELDIHPYSPRHEDCISSAPASRGGPCFRQRRHYCLLHDRRQHTIPITPRRWKCPRGRCPFPRRSARRCRGSSARRSAGTGTPGRRRSRNGRSCPRPARPRAARRCANDSGSRPKPLTVNGVQAYHGDARRHPAREPQPAARAHARRLLRAAGRRGRQRPRPSTWRASAASRCCRSTTVVRPSSPIPPRSTTAWRSWKGALEDGGPEEHGDLRHVRRRRADAVDGAAREAGRLPLPGRDRAGHADVRSDRTGDSFQTNHMVDNVLVGSDGRCDAMAKLYANGHDLKDPMLSPVYGDMHGFPPTLLTTGTRDLAAQQHRARAPQAAPGRRRSRTARLRRAVARALHAGRGRAGDEGGVRGDREVLR